MNKKKAIKSINKRGRDQRGQHINKEARRVKYQSNHARGRGFDSRREPRQIFLSGMKSRSPID